MFSEILGKTPPSTHCDFVSVLTDIPQDRELPTLSEVHIHAYN